MNCSLRRIRQPSRTAMWMSVAIAAIILTAAPGEAFAKGQAAAPASRQEKETSAAQLLSDGMAAYGNKDYRLAAALLKEAVAKGATQIDVLYNAACAFALSDNAETAFQLLEKAIAAGYRNSTHLKYDVDFNSLHRDPRWAKSVAACEEAQAKFLKEHSDPANARFITSDISRFWAAFDKVIAAPVEERVAIFQRDYIDRGSVGLHDFAASGRLNAKALAKTIDSHQKFFKAIRPLTSRIETELAPTVAAFRKFKDLYPQAVFPDVYFVIGQLQSGGTSSDNGLLMGAEMFSRSAETPREELTDWQREAIAPQSDIPALVAHESVHFQQKNLALGGLLCACLKEGSADFLGELSSGRLIARMEATHTWANARERELWEEFRKEMDGKDTSHWLYGSSGGNGRPVDLGYWMGYKISESYFKNAADKKQAVRDTLLMKDCKEFLNTSHYAEKFGALDSK